MTSSTHNDPVPPFLPNALTVGQGFNIYGTYNSHSLKGSLFDPRASSSPQWVNGQTYLVPDYIEAIDTATSEEKKHAGTSREEFQQSVAATAGINVKYGAFSSQFKASYSVASENVTEHMFAYTTYYDWIYQMQLKTVGDLLPFLSASFKAAVQALPDEVKTPAQLSVFYRFFETYGAYYTRLVTVGASLEFYVDVNTLSDLRTVGLRASMDAQYKGLFTTGSVNADVKKTQMWKSYEQYRSSSLKVSGGDDTARAQLQGIDPDAPSDQTVAGYKKWTETKGTTPITMYFQLAPITNLCGDKYEVVGEAWGKIWPTLHPKMYIETTSADIPNSGPVVVLSNKSGPITPTNPKTSNMGCLVALLSRQTLETLSAQYYCFNPQTWKVTYPVVYNQIAQDIKDSPHNNENSVLIFVTMGLIGITAKPTDNLYSLLLSAGAGRGLQEWRNAPSTYVNYALVGIPTFGVGTGAESYATTLELPASMRTGAYFYKDFSNQPYDVALDTAATLMEAETTADSEPETTDKQ